MITSCNNYEGLLNMQLARVQSVHKKLSGRLDNSDTADTLLARNSLIMDSAPVDLYPRGKACLDNAVDICEKLRLLEEVCTSLACDDHAQLEYTSSFLVRGFNDAEQSGLRLPIQIPAVAVRRHALAALIGGKFQQLGHASLSLFAEE